MSRFLSICVVLLSVAHARAQLPSVFPLVPNCTPAAAPPIVTPVQQPNNNGQWLTSHGPLKVLIIMAEFPDDNYLPMNAQWPAGQPPVWVTNPRLLVEPLTQYGQPTFSPLPFSLADYFFRMSGSNMVSSLRMYGTVVHHVYNKTRQTVANNNMSADAVNIEVLQAVDQQLDLETYDRWATNNPYQHAYIPNGWLDYVIICWRNVDRDLDGILNFTLLRELRDLDYRHPTRAQINWTYMPDVAVDSGARFIRTGWPDRKPPLAPFRLASGAGVHFTNFLDAAPMVRSTGAVEGNFRGLVHETGHLLIGGGHPEGGNWSMIANADHRSYCPSAREMIDLGWATPTVTVPAGSSVTPSEYTVGDLYTTGNCIAVEVNTTGTRDEWYILENHQMLSPYDYTTAYDAKRNDAKGMYVLFHNEGSRQHIQSASGEYLWDDTRRGQIYGGTGAIFERLSETRSAGFTQSEIIPVTTPFVRGNDTVRRFPVYAVWENGDRVDKDYHLGEFADDHHDLCRKPVWSPWSSPSSAYVRHDTLNTTNVTGVTVWLQSMAGSAYNVKIGTLGSIVSPPSEPINFDVPANSTANYIGVTDEYEAELAWSANTEPDLAGYRIYRKPGTTTTDWELIADVPTSTLTYTDVNHIHLLNATTLSTEVGYRLVAYDSASQESSLCTMRTVQLEWLNTAPGCCTYTMLHGEDVVAELATTTTLVQPNPATHTVALYPADAADLQGMVTLTVSTLTGATVREFTFHWDVQRQGVSVNLEGLIPGGYFVRITNGRAMRTATVVVR